MTGQRDDDEAVRASGAPGAPHAAGATGATGATGEAAGTAITGEQLSLDVPTASPVPPVPRGSTPGSVSSSGPSAAGVVRRARLLVAYDGAGFHGFAEATDQRTVMGELRTAIERVVRIATEPVGAGRTDAGVHAWGQVVSVDLPDDTDLERLAHRITRMCGPAIVVRSAEWCADPEFSARFSASYRQYRYHVLNTPRPVPALAATTWHVAAPLERWAMQLACDPVIGEHDFASFCRAPKVRDGHPVPSLHRRVLLADWHEVTGEYGPLLRFEIRANAFCHQMVRSLVGTMVDIGSGRLHAGEMRSILLRRDRAAAGQVAPPQGLMLWEVGYQTSVSAPTSSTSSTSSRSPHGTVPR